MHQPSLRPRGSETGNGQQSCNEHSHLLAGVNQMPWPRFLLANAAGAVVWASIIGLGAFLFGRAFHQIVGPISLAIFVLATIALVWGFVYLRRHEAALEVEAERVLPGPCGSAGQVDTDLNGAARRRLEA